MSINTMLDDLANLYAQRDLMVMEKQKLRDALLTPEILQQLNDIDEEWRPKEQTVLDKIAEMEEVIRNSTIEQGHRVDGTVLTCSFVKPSTKWDTNGLNGYAIAHPEILIFRKTGAPSARIIKKGK